MPGQDTKERILDAAESLFARSGVEGASLRAITRTAGVNLAAVHYHLGSKEALLAAVLVRRVGPVNQARLKRLEELEGEAQGAPCELEALLRAFLEPPIRMLEAEERGVLLAKLLSRLYSARLFSAPSIRCRPTRCFAASSSCWAC